MRLGRVAAWVLALILLVGVVGVVAGGAVSRLRQPSQPEASKPPGPVARATSPAPDPAIGESPKFIFFFSDNRVCVLMLKRPSASDSFRPH